MNISKLVQVVVIVIVSFHINTAHSIKCYQCNSYTDPSCADLLPNDTSSPFLKSCEPHQDYQMFCRKIVQTVLEPRFTRVTRRCGWLVHKNNQSNCFVSDTDFKLETTCQCFTDACNTGPITLPSSTIALITFSSCVYRLLL